ncbi:LOW QUALITY PROTEIN: BTB/POZ domain-containing protein At3g49900 [Asparagus officinalis]|uniref:LOW QUALITY PROTEIN: BTB/POZ domain-containing protein At3g49900 n=1 Tax=Asparagus officinalis TaxID=4686 RepID=UPI00098E63C2|nr:LOW QUALITY PROTEIN: BTB/POZ domain-containing protein At3g49900 [Asparagus officinalis]
MKGWDELGVVDTIYEEEEERDPDASRSLSLTPSITASPTSPRSTSSLLSPSPTSLNARVEEWSKMTGRKTDIIIRLHDHCFFLHKDPLISRSRYLCRRLTESTEITINAPSKITAETFSEIILFCYDSSINLTPSNVAAVRIAADWLEMDVHNGEGNGGLTWVTRDLYFRQEIAGDGTNAEQVLRTCVQLLPDVNGGIARCNHQRAYNREQKIQLCHCINPAKLSQHLSIHLVQHPRSPSASSPPIHPPRPTSNTRPLLHLSEPPPSNLQAPLHPRRHPPARRHPPQLLPPPLVYPGHIMIRLVTWVTRTTVGTRVVELEGLRTASEKKAWSNMTAIRVLPEPDSRKFTLPIDCVSDPFHEVKRKRDKKKEPPSTLGAILQRDAILRNSSHLRSSIQATSFRIESLERDLDGLRRKLRWSEEKGSSSFRVVGDDGARGGCVESGRRGKGIGRKLLDGFKSVFKTLPSSAAEVATAQRHRRNNSFA